MRKIAPYLALLIGLATNLFFVGQWTGQVQADLKNISDQVRDQNSEMKERINRIESHLLNKERP